MNPPQENQKKPTWDDFVKYGNSVMNRLDADGGSLSEEEIVKGFQMAESLDETSIPDNIAFPYDGRDEQDERRTRSSQKE